MHIKFSKKTSKKIRLSFGFLYGSLMFILTLVSSTYSWIYDHVQNPGNEVQTSDHDLTVSILEEDPTTFPSQVGYFQIDTYEYFQNLISFESNEVIQDSTQETFYLALENESLSSVQFDLRFYFRELTNITFQDSQLLVYDQDNLVVAQVYLSQLSTDQWNVNELENEIILPGTSLIYRLVFSYEDTTITLTSNQKLVIGAHVASWPSNSPSLKPTLITNQSEALAFVNQSDHYHFHLLNNLSISDNLLFLKTTNFNLWGNQLTVNQVAFSNHHYGAMVWKNGILNANQVSISSGNLSVRHLENFEVFTNTMSLSTTSLGYQLKGLMHINETLTLQGITTLKINLMANLNIFGSIVQMNQASWTFDYDAPSYHNVYIANEPDWNDILTIGSKSQFLNFIQRFNLSLPSNIQIELIRNIDLDNTPINQIGSPSKTFKGIFDGKGHTIDGIFVTHTSKALFNFNEGQIFNAKFVMSSSNHLYSTSNDYDYALLIRKNKGVVRNIELDIQNQTLIGNFPLGNIGLVTAEDLCTNSLECGTKVYENILIKGSLNVQVTADGIIYVGGLIGYSSTNLRYDLINIENQAALEILNRGASMVGGVVGSVRKALFTKVGNRANHQVTSQRQNATLGGVVGELSDGYGTALGQSIFLKTYHVGNLNNISYTNVNYDFGITGGLVGKIDALKVTVENSMSVGNIYTRYDTANTPQNVPYSGGMVGKTSPMYVIIKKSIFIGEVTSINTAGSNVNAFATGFVGMINGGLDRKINFINNVVYGTSTINANNNYQSAYLPHNLAFYGSGIESLDNSYYYFINSFNYNTIQNNNIGLSIDNVEDLNSAFFIDLQWNQSIWNLENINFSLNQYPNLY